MQARILSHGDSRSFPAGDAFLDTHAPDGDVLVVIGAGAGAALAAIDLSTHAAVAVELEGACLGTIIGAPLGEEGGTVVGFARHRTGTGAPTRTVEIVTHPHTSGEALARVTAVFEAAGFVVVTCADRDGRILDRLMRPYFNRALEALDLGLAPAETLDRTLRLGLGYPRGPLEILSEEGLAAHFEVSSRLHAALGERAYLPARRARVAAERAAGQDKELRQ
ncbi:3-hydroxyacyl-CoA dehydrogenase family protein [Xanthobacter oligotrophicus]|uniref:3-hydroxyacyl-CoA dehydrogenase family protein n=1 Tax=Xanthobacter oligotrophicus TaxID=2607286 RepID=A0ABW7A571_9HYPH